MSTIQFKEANCKNCYKCIRSCPVKAIDFKNEQAAIMEERCVLCGKCLLVCPQNAKSVKSDVDKVKQFIKKNEKVYVSIAPSFVAAFNEIDPQTVFSALKKLGFTHVEETAIGAVRVSKEYERLMKERKMANIISTACPTTVFLIEKHFPGLIDQMAPVVSPMIAHAKMMRSMYGRIKVVFIGPCLSKKEECDDLQNNGMVDAVITFEELEKWMNSEGIDFSSIKDMEELKGIQNSIARYYPVPGGIIKTLGVKERKLYKVLSVDGVDRCMEVLEALQEGDISNYFIEMNACAGGCLGGPCMKPLKGGFLKAKDCLMDYVKKSSKEPGSRIVENAEVSMYKKFVDRSTTYKMPNETEIRDILGRIGKFSEDKELNCGACGYSTCREKAIAVYNNKAQLHMCLPYMRERAESISNIIIHSTPNAIFALNEELCIQECNLAARHMFGMNMDDVSGMHIYQVLECEDFERVRETGENIVNRKYTYSKHNITVEQSIMLVKEHNIIIVVIKDITGEELKQQQMYKMRSETVEIAQKVIEKQMRVAQEIASLLGETTAETKIALTKLKNSILSDAGDDK